MITKKVERAVKKAGRKTTSLVPQPVDSIDPSKFFICIVRADKSLSTIVTSAGKRTARMLVAYFILSQCCHVALERRGLFYEGKENFFKHQLLDRSKLKTSWKDVKIFGTS